MYSDTVDSYDSDLFSAVLITKIHNSDVIFKVITMVSFLNFSRK